EQTAALQPVDPVETAAARPLPEPEPEPEPEQTPTPKQTPRPTPDPKPKPKARSDPRAAAQPTPTSETVSQSNRIRSEQTAADAARNRSGFGDADRGAERAASGRGSQSSAGDGSGTGSGNDEGISNYYGRLATWLARHKRYPAQARRLRQEGTVKVTFTITSSGRVVSKRIVQSSGHALLDREVEAMLERASPLPRIPTSLGRKRLTITVPVAFALR
ncbi:energy transducer TonB, partial [Halochromatium sp.]